MDWIDLATWTLVGLSIGGCGSTDDAPPSADEAIIELAEVRCERSASCECGQDALQGDACEAHVQESLTQTLETAEALGLHYDAECMLSVLDSARTDECQTRADAFGGVDLLAESDQCGTCSLFYGDLELGSACELSLDFPTPSGGCARGLLCRRSICVDPCATVGVGEDCSAAYCEPSMRCEFVDGANWTCVAEAAEGEPCADAFCAPNMFCSEGICAPALAVGEPCILSSSCNDQGYCDSPQTGEPGVCVAKKADGEACEESTQCAIGWCDDGTCGPGETLQCISG